MRALRLVHHLLVAALVRAACGRGSDTCVTTFHEFEKAAIVDSPGNVEALVREFYETNNPLPLSVQVVFHVNSSNGTDAYISTDPDCPAGKEMWLWVASPVFIFMEPTKLNLCALLTLNYFQYWKPRKAHIYVPNICNKSHHKFNFLNDLTSRVEVYAAAHLNERSSPGYVLRGCGDDALTTLLPTTLPNNGQGLEYLSKVFICIYLLGSVFLVFGVILGIGLLLHRYGNKIANKTDHPSFDNYGLFWGCVLLSVLGNVLLTWHSIAIIKPYVTSDAYELHAVGWIVLAQVLIAMFLPLIVAIYFGIKLDQSIPFIMFLLAPLCCNRVKRARRKVVQCLSLWSLIMCLLHILGRVGMVGLALLALPPTVLFTLLIYLVAVICTVQFLAILFAFCKMERMSSLVLGLCQALAFTLLFFAVLCFGLLISAIGALANYGTIRISLYSVFSIFVTPPVALVVVWTLRKTGALWLRSVEKGDAQGEDEQRGVKEDAGAAAKQDDANEITSLLPSLDVSDRCAML